MKLLDWPPLPFPRPPLPFPSRSKKKKKFLRRNILKRRRKTLTLNEKIKPWPVPAARCFHRMLRRTTNLLHNRLCSTAIKPTMQSSRIFPLSPNAYKEDSDVPETEGEDNVVYSTQPEKIKRHLFLGRAIMSFRHNPNMSMNQHSAKLPSLAPTAIAKFMSPNPHLPIKTAQA